MSEFRYSSFQEFWKQNSDGFFKIILGPDSYCCLQGKHLQPGPLTLSLTHPFPALSVLLAKHVSPKELGQLPEEDNPMCSNNIHRVTIKPAFDPEVISMTPECQLLWYLLEKER